MKKGRIILTMVAFAFAIVSAFASHFEKTPNAIAYGVVGTATCTDGLLTTANSCQGNSSKPICHVEIVIGGTSNFVQAFSTNGSPACATALYRTVLP